MNINSTNEPRFDVEFAEHFVKRVDEFLELKKNCSGFTFTMFIGLDLGEIYIFVVSIIMPNDQVHTIKVKRSEAENYFLKPFSDFLSKRRIDYKDIFDYELSQEGFKEFTAETYQDYVHNFVQNQKDISSIIYDDEYDKMVRDCASLKKKFFTEKTNDLIQECLVYKAELEEFYNGVYEVDMIFGLGFSKKYSGKGNNYSSEFEKEFIRQILDKKFKIFYVQEYYTSTACAICFHETKRLYQYEHRIKFCYECMIAWHRDVLGSLNIASNNRHIFNENGVPEVFKFENHTKEKLSIKRQERSSSDTDFPADSDNSEIHSIFDHSIASEVSDYITHNNHQLAEKIKNNLDLEKIDKQHSIQSYVHNNNSCYITSILEIIYGCYQKNQNIFDINIEKASVIEKIRDITKSRFSRHIHEEPENAKLLCKELVELRKIMQTIDIIPGSLADPVDIYPKLVLTCDQLSTIKRCIVSCSCPNDEIITHSWHIFHIFGPESIDTQIQKLLGVRRGFDALCNFCGQKKIIRTVIETPPFIAITTNKTKWEKFITIASARYELQGRTVFVNDAHHFSIVSFKYPVPGIYYQNDLNKMTSKLTNDTAMLDLDASNFGIYTKISEVPHAPDVLSVLSEYQFQELGLSVVDNKNTHSDNSGIVTYQPFNPLTIRLKIAFLLMKTC